MPFYIGGYERRYWELAKRLSQHNEVHVFSSCPEDIKIEKVIFHKVISPTSFFSDRGYRLIGQDLLFSLGLKRLIKYKFDIVDVNATPFVHIPLARLFTYAKEEKFILTVHETFLDTQVISGYFEQKASQNSIPSKFSSRAISNFAKLFVHFVYMLPDILVAVSRITLNSLVSYGFDNVKLIPNGIDFKFFEKVKAYNNFDSDYNIVFVGRLVPEKRIIDILKSAAILKQKYDLKSQIHIIGTGPQHQLRALHSSAKTLGVERQVRIYGYVSDIEKARILKSCQIFVLPSIREGFSIATLEAMSCGLPPVVASSPYSSASGVLELVKHRYTGMTYPLGQVDKLAEVIYFLYHDNRLRRQMALNCKELAKQYEWNQIAAKYEELIKRALTNI